ncbi:SsrA-binding protein SmpB [Geovibrio sp. ADMFC3]
MATLARNKKAFFDYEIIEKFEAGIVLQGTEVKSTKGGNINLKDSFVKIIGEEMHLINCHISEYKQGNISNHEPTRSRKLLLHKKEITRLIGKMNEKGLSVVPLSVYLNSRNFIKAEIALVKGKKSHDKRQVIKERDLQREISRDFKIR